MFTVAGVESTSAFAPTPCAAEFCTVPSSWPRAWTATERRLRATCLTHLRDDTILICQGRELLALGHDGRLRRWLSVDAGLDVGPWVDADAAPDGSVVLLGRRGIARVLPGGTVTTLVRAPVVSGVATEQQLASTVAAAPDGGVLVGEFTPWWPGAEAADLVRVGPDGSVSPIRRELPRGRAAKFASDAFDDLVALPDG